MIATSKDLEADTVIRRFEGVLLAPLTVLYLLAISGVATKWLTTGEALKFDLGKWFAMGGVWGLVSLWWLIVRVNPHRAPSISRMPLGIWIGIILGVIYLVQLIASDLQRRSFDPTAHWMLFLVCGVPLAILCDRLRVLWRYRNSENVAI